jgi:hypothetical protein
MCVRYLRVTFILPVDAGFVAFYGPLILHIPQALVHYMIVNAYKVTKHFNFVLGSNLKLNSSTIERPNGFCFKEY